MDEFGQNQVQSLQQHWQNNALAKPLQGRVAQSLDVSQAGRVYFIPYYRCQGLPGPIGTELYLSELQTQLLLDRS